MELPTALLGAVLSFLHPTGELLVGAGAVCTHWREVATADLRWKQLASEHYGSGAVADFEAVRAKSGSPRTQVWLRIFRRLRSTRQCLRCGKLYSTDGNGPLACRYHPGELLYKNFLVSSWECCGKVVPHNGRPANAPRPGMSIYYNRGGAQHRQGPQPKVAYPMRRGDDGCRSMAHKAKDSWVDQVRAAPAGDPVVHQLFRYLGGSVIFW